MRRTTPFLTLIVTCGALFVVQASAETHYFDGPAPRIVNGLTTQDFPTTGALLLGGNPATASSHCTGTLIGCETFLTAAHCVEDDLNPASYTVFFQHGGFHAVTQINVPAAYSFPVADLAVLKLATPVSGISPTPIDTTGGHVNGTQGTIVGFGKTGGGALDFGIKRFGSVAIADCTFGVSNTTSICWDFNNPLGPPASNSNTCNADSGGPLFIDPGGGTVVAGITSGGNTSGCMPFDNSFDTRVSFYASDIQTWGGADLNNTLCGSGPHVGDVDVEIFSFENFLTGSTTERLHSFSIDQGASLLRVTLNGEDNGTADFDLYVRQGAPPTTSVFDCGAFGGGQYASCDLNNPTGGVWYALATRSSGSGTYQVTATSFGTFCSDPANDGLACDDENSCTTGEACQAGVCSGTTLANGTACTDGDACTTPDTCQAGVCIGQSTCGDGVIQASCEQCDDGGTAGGDGCDTSCDVETCFVCSGEPSSCGAPSACTTSAKSALVIKDELFTGSKDKLVWKWLKGTANLPDFGDPVLSTGYSLCLWEDGAVVAQATVSPGGTCGSKPCWKKTGSIAAPKGFKFKNKDTNSDGVLQVGLKAGAGKAKLLWKGRGTNLLLPGAANASQYFAGGSLMVQLLRDDDTTCWQSEFTPADFKKNTPTKMKAVR